jgi:AraC family transcriptional regulator of adaptative response/methylated-DNA-[protein]-cysteine methyltransferase
MLAEHKAQWPRARYIKDQDATGTIANRIFSDQGNAAQGPVDLFVKGTNFQIKVWEALLKIPPGTLVSYGDIARLIDQPKAARAVGSANAKNQVALLIPCHRVIRESGVFGEYRWGTTRKLAMFAWERARYAQRMV